MLVTYMTFHSPAQDIPRFNNSPNQTVRKAILTRSQRHGHKFPDSKIICKLKENIHPKLKLKRVLRNNSKGFFWWSSSLTPHTARARRAGSPGWGTKISHAMWHSQKDFKKLKNNLKKEVKARLRHVGKRS